MIDAIDSITKKIAQIVVWLLVTLLCLFVAYDYWETQGQTDVFFTIIGGFLFLCALVSIPVFVIRYR